MKRDLREALKSGRLIGDGAMGTYLYQLGFPVGISYEELNLTKPEIIGRVHREYYEAGARLIETNTYSASRERLARYGLEGEVGAINRKGVEIARAAAGDDAYIVGAVGPIRAGKRKNVRTAVIESDFDEQIGTLADTPVDGLLLETFFDLEEMLIALRIARRHTDLPVICQFAVNDAGRTTDGHPVEEAFRALLDEGADAVGFNCRTGPAGILRAVERIRPHVAAPLTVFPNAGIPDYVDGRYQYVSTPQYFADCAVRFADLDVRVIGGCCGTTPDHIRSMAGALQNYKPREEVEQSRPAGERPLAPAVEVRERPRSEAGPPSGPEMNLAEAAKRRHTVIVELDPPRDLDISRFMAGSAELKEAGADAITMADNSLAVTRMSNMALGALLKERLGIRPLVHIACRDRNLIGTQSHLMGLDALGIDHVLAVTGDPAKFGDLPGSSSVYDLTSFEIIRMIKQLNEGIAFSGKPLKQKAKFVVGAAFNPNVRNLDKAVARMERKIKAGADFIMTQPVYDAKLIERIHEMTRHLDVPIFIGIMPLANGRNAEYLHNEVPGIQLSDEVRQRMRGLENEEGRRMGIRISKELLDAAMPLFNGIYLITPFMHYAMTAELTRYVREKAAAFAGRREASG